MSKKTNSKIVLTIDLEDWFHSLDPDPGSWSGYERRIIYGTEKLLEFLSVKKSQATFFVLGEAAVHNPGLIKLIHGEGHEIGSHGFNHEFIYNMSPPKFRSDLRKSLDLLRDLIGEQIFSYRAPYFSITNNSIWALDILFEEGIRYDSSMFPIINHRYGIPGGSRLPFKFENGLWEWPVSTYRALIGNFPFAGGVYFRFLPLRVTKFFLSSLVKKGEPALFYIHPWEMDSGQPRSIRSSPFLHFRHYYALERTYSKMTSAFADFDTISLSQGIERLKNEKYFPNN